MFTNFGDLNTAEDVLAFAGVLAERDEAREELDELWNAETASVERIRATA